MSAPIFTIRVFAAPDPGKLLSARGVSLLFGVPVEDVVAHMAVNGISAKTFSPEWVRSGRRRSKEAQARGHTDMVSAMAYWAERDHGAHLVVEYIHESFGAVES